jgi:hypothetical protein
MYTLNAWYGERMRWRKSILSRLPVGTLAFTLVSSGPRPGFFNELLPKSRSIFHIYYFRQCLMATWTAFFTTQLQVSRKHFHLIYLMLMMPAPQFRFHIFRHSLPAFLDSMSMTLFFYDIIFRWKFEVRELGSYTEGGHKYLVPGPYSATN